MNQKQIQDLAEEITAQLEDSGHVDTYRNGAKSEIEKVLKRRLSPPERESRDTGVEL